MSMNMRRRERRGRVSRCMDAVLLAFLLCVLFLDPLAALAADTASSDPGQTLPSVSAVYDFAGLFTKEEEEALSKRAGELRTIMEMDVAVVTTDENRESAQVFADRFYQDQGLGIGESHSGAMLLMDMENREIYITTEGRMLLYLPDSRLEAVLDDVYRWMTQGEYGQAAMAFFEDVGLCYDNGIGDGSYYYDTETGKVSRIHRIVWYEALVAFAAAAACGGAAVFAVVREYGMHEDEKRLEANFKLYYRKDSTFRPGLSLPEILLGTYVTQQIISSTRNRGPRTGGGLSGGGRISTHTFRGRTHGGGGRKF